MDNSMPGPALGDGFVLGVLGSLTKLEPNKGI